MKKVTMSLFVLVLSIFFVTGVASAHVKVHPLEVQADSFQQFTVTVPSEKDIPTHQIKVIIPDNVDVASFKPKVGWTYKTKKNSNGKITEVTWTSKDKGILASQFDEFNMMAHVDKDAKTIDWKAYQTYSDGTVVKWIGPEDSEHPASVSKVVASKETSDQSDTQWPLYLSIIAVALSVVSIILSLVKRK